MEDLKDNIEPIQSLPHLNHLRRFRGESGNGDGDKTLEGASQLRCKVPQHKLLGNLDLLDSKEPWTEREELEMLITHQKYQNKWSNVAQMLNGRSNNSIKNRFYSIFRKIKNKIKKHDINYSSRFELLEAIYIISLMEQYFAHPLPPQEHIGKRGKDFIYSLLKGLYIEEVVKYKGDLQKSLGKKTSLEELWWEMINQNLDTKQGEPMPTPENKIPNSFAPIMEFPVYEKLVFTLPLPNEVQSKESLTSEEKEFVMSQTFQNKEPFSAGSYFQYPILTPSYSSQAPLSAGIPPARSYFEGFSDFTEMYNPLSQRLTAQTSTTSAFHAFSNQNQSRSENIIGETAM